MKNVSLHAAWNQEGILFLQTQLYFFLSCVKYGIKLELIAKVVWLSACFTFNHDLITQK